MATAEPFDFHGMPAIRLRARDGASAIATLQGAQVVSWIPAGGAECLYVSERSPFEAGRPIRGGIPVVFPQFGDRGALGQHGFARTQAWRFGATGESPEAARMAFKLEASAQTLAQWSGAFELELVATIGGNGLDVAMRVRNAGATAFTFTAALHTYLRVADAACLHLEGLRGTRYANRGSSTVNVEANEVVRAAEPIDRDYFGAPAATRLVDGSRILTIAQRGFADTVVWNPGRERTSRMADMPPDGHRSMLCVEAAALDPPVRVEPGAEWTGGQSIVLTTAT